MTTLEDHQFEILATETATSGFVFGIGAKVSLDDGGFDPGESSWLTQDTQNSRRGVTGFGRDVLGGKTWTWSSHVNRQDEEEALDTLDEFSAAWAPELTVREQGALSVVRYSLGGRNRRIYGRPRRFAAPPSNLILGGYVPVTHDFQMVDGFTYDDAESSAEIGFSSVVTGGGFVLPDTFPVSTFASESNGGDQLTIGGRARAYPIIRFNGPWTNPVFETDDWTIGWTGEVANGGWVEVDCRPWKLSVKNQSGASVVGGLDRKVWLEDCWFAPQSRPQISLDGFASSGSASATVRWRNTWTSI